MKRARTGPIAIFLLACGAGQPAAETGGQQARAEEGAPCEGDKLPHPQLTAEQYKERIESPERPQWQQPARVVQAVGIEPGMHVAEVGTGAGFWLPYLDEAVAPDGRIVGEDIDAGLLRLARERVRKRGLAHVELRQGRHDDPALERGRYDRILLVNTYHHVCDKPALLTALREALAPRGRVVVIDFRAGQQIPMAAGAHRIVRREVVRRMRRAGLVLAEEHEFLPYQYLLEFRRADEP